MSEMSRFCNIYNIVCFAQFNDDVIHFMLNHSFFYQMFGKEFCVFEGRQSLKRVM